MDDEKQLDDFLIKAQEPPTPAPGDKQQTEEETVEQKAREGKPLAQSILQKRTVLSETQLNARIAATIRKNPEIDEGELRQRLAAKLEEGDITEGDYAKIVNNLLSKQEEANQEGPAAEAAIQPPTFITSGVAGLQEKTTRLADWAGSLATPGGIGILVFALFFFIWVIVPTSGGKTRMQLLWQVITGQTEINPSLEAQGGGADFGNTPAPGESVNSIGGGRVGTNTEPLYYPDFEVN